jgi:diphosphomevalonate decarboxylase
VVESEALTLHAMMMTSMPYFILMKPNTLQIINAIWKFRTKPVCFTLDAGATMFYIPKTIALQFYNLLGRISWLCQNGQYICDEIGNGSKN